MGRQAVLRAMEAQLNNSERSLYDSNLPGSGWERAPYDPSQKRKCPLYPTPP